MASAFAHAYAAVALGSIWPIHRPKTAKFWLLAAGASIFPDADVVGFLVGIRYEDVLGHRGLSHSIVFALLTGLLISERFFRDEAEPVPRRSRAWMSFAAFFFVVTLSHAVLDAMTDGGLGIGFFIPFDNTRYFFPFRPLVVSPIGAAAFFSKWGLAVLRSEAVWVGIPCSALIAASLIRARLSAGAR